TKQFGLRIVRMFSRLPKTTEAQVLGKQILRSGTSVGANYRRDIAPAVNRSSLPSAVIDFVSSRRLLTFQFSSTRRLRCYDGRSVRRLYRGQRNGTEFCLRHFCERKALVFQAAIVPFCHSVQRIAYRLHY